MQSIAGESGISIHPPNAPPEEIPEKIRALLFNMEVNNAIRAEKLFDFPKKLPSTTQERLKLLLDEVFLADNPFDRMSVAYKVAKELGCTEIVVHNGFVPNTSFYEGWVRNATAFWQEFFSDKDDSITMMIENQCEEDSEVLKMEIDSVNDPRLKICLVISMFCALRYAKLSLKH